MDFFTSSSTLQYVVAVGGSDDEDKYWIYRARLPFQAGQYAAWKLDLSGVVTYPEHVTISCRLQTHCMLVFSAVTASEKKFVRVDITMVDVATDLTNLARVFELGVTANHELTSVLVTAGILLSYKTKSYTWLDN